VKGSDGKEYPGRGDRLGEKVGELQVERYRLQEELAERDRRLQRLERQLAERNKKIQQIENERDMYKRKSEQPRYNFGDNGLKVFAFMVGLNEDASVTEISRAFRKAQAKAHPDGGVDFDWISKRYNDCSDRFKRMYAQ
jgi:predicted  nucleic acid-binding Zn-ribbon protein